MVEIISKVEKYDELKEALASNWQEREVVTVASKYYILHVNDFGPIPIEIDLSNSILGLPEASMFLPNFVVKDGDSFWIVKGNEWVDLSTQPYIEPSLNLSLLFQQLNKQFKTFKKNHTLSFDSSENKLKLNLYPNDQKVTIRVDQNELVNVSSLIQELKESL